MRAFELFSSIAMVLWKRFLPFFHKSKLPALIPFLVKISWKYDFSIFFYSCSLFFAQNRRKNRYFCFFLKNALFWLFLLHFSQNLWQTTLMRYLKGFLLLFLQSPRRVKSFFRSVIAWLGVILKFTLLSWAFGQPYCWYLQNLKLTKLHQNYWKCENHSALTTNFCFKLGKGWKSQYALGRVLRFSAKKLPW